MGLAVFAKAVQRYDKCPTLQNIIFLSPLWGNDAVKQTEM